MNLRADFTAAPHSADFRLLISAVGKDGTYLATIASIPLKDDDPTISTQLRHIAQAFRMGARFGRETS